MVLQNANGVAVSHAFVDSLAWWHWLYHVCTFASNTGRGNHGLCRDLLRFVQLGSRQLISSCFAIASAHLTCR
jgi:hypothetical protein